MPLGLDFPSVLIMYPFAFWFSHATSVRMSRMQVHLEKDPRGDFGLTLAPRLDASSGLSALPSTPTHTPRSPHLGALGQRRLGQGWTVHQRCCSCCGLHQRGADGCRAGHGCACGLGVECLVVCFEHLADAAQVILTVMRGTAMQEVSYGL